MPRLRIEGTDRAGLERLLRYCARPPFALERAEQVGHDQLVYRRSHGLEGNALPGSPNTGTLNSPSSR